MSVCDDIQAEINTRTSQIPVLAAAKDLADAAVDLAYAEWQVCVTDQSNAAAAIAANNSAIADLNAAKSMNNCP